MVYDLIDHFIEDAPGDGTLMALDFGEVKIGIAFCDPDRLVATPAPVYIRRNMSKDLGELNALATNHNAVSIIMGLPLKLDGSESENCEKVRHFAKKLAKKTSLPVLLFDERMTTSAVDRVMKDHGAKRKTRNESDDSLAACYLLQTIMQRLTLNQ